MVIKVCGILTKENVNLISKLKVDMVGLNFYPPSVRYVDPKTLASHFDVLPSALLRVGVFVNESIETIEKLAMKFKLDYIQLHGDEDLEFCKSVAINHKIIKVFRIGVDTDFKQISAYSFADYFLFDTATKHYGGSGKKFDWSKLNEYTDDTQFLLSGGIGSSDIELVMQLNHPQYIGIDINSKFESKPAIKDPELLTPFINKLRSSD